MWYNCCSQKQMTALVYRDAIDWRFVLYIKHPESERGMDIKMKKVLKIIGILLLCIIAFIVVLLIFLSKRQFVAKDYSEKTETGGTIEANYMKRGAYEVSYYEEPTMQGFEKYEIYYPTELKSKDKKYPVVVFANGTGAKVSKYHALLEHMASWGFIAIGTEEEYDWNGFASEMCIRHLMKLNEIQTVNEKENIFYDKVDFDNVGITGHSQGGVGVISAITATEHKDIYKAAVALSPTNKELAKNLEWEYDATKVSTPIMLLSGAGGGDDWVVTGEQLQDIYQDIDARKVMMRRKNTPHGEMLYSADGYVTAWFMWHLQGDAEAAKAFVGDNPEIMDNEMYQDQQRDIKVIDSVSVQKDNTLLKTRISRS